MRVAGVDGAADSVARTLLRRQPPPRRPQSPSCTCRVGRRVGIVTGMSDALPKVIRLNELGDIVAAVPFLLGFEPVESLVVVSMTGPRERLSFSMRVDLPADEHNDDVARIVGQRMAHADAASVMVFVYTDADHVDGQLPRQELVEELIRRCSVAVRDAVLVTRDRIWSYVCVDAGCCPAEGRPRNPSAPGTVAVAAANALHGNVVLPSREALVATVAPVGGIAARSMDQAITRAGEMWATSGRAASRRSAEAVADDLRRRYCEPPAGMTDDEAAQLVVGLHDVVLRDRMLSWCDVDEEAMRALLGDLARRALPPLDAPACTALAWVAYLQGDGVVVATALERALRSDPEYSLAGLLDAALTGQVHPRRLRATMKDLSGTG